MIPLKKPNLRRCFNFPVIATYAKYALFLENFAPCILGFLSGIIFQDFFQWNQHNLKKEAVFKSIKIKCAESVDLLT